MNTATLLAALLPLWPVPVPDWSAGMPPLGWTTAQNQARPFPPGFPSRQPKPVAPQKPATVVTYSQSARASKMLLPAIWLGLPTIVIIALIILASRKD